MNGEVPSDNPQATSRIARPGWWRLLLPLSFAFCALCFSARAAELPSGFIEDTLATNLNAATALTVAPDGRIFIADQTGVLRVWKNGRLLTTPVLDLTGRLDDYWERGLIGVTLHPDFPRTPNLFVLYVAKQPFTHHVLSRFTMLGDQADPASERILIEGDDQSTLGGKVPHGHQGGPIRFGPDGKLYIGLGEQTAGDPSQRLDSLLGKILRINPDGSIPEDNPFVRETTGKYRAIWAVGLRNPFGLAFQPETGRLFESDVGQTAWEEVNEIVRGANYGWPHAEGLSTNTAFRNPLHVYPPVIGRSIVGATFYPRAFPQTPDAIPYPPSWRGKFFFADWAAHWIKALDPENPTNAVTFAKGFNAPATIEAAPDGSLLVLNRGTIWRDGKKWQANSGSLVRVRYVGEAAAPQSTRAPLPRTLMASGLLRSAAPVEMHDGFTEYQINLPPWQPGVSARRWISLPRDGRLAVNDEGEFEFPTGTIVLLHHVTTAKKLAFETHVLWFTGPRTARAAAYRWNANGTDATLVEDGEVIPLPDDPARQWFSPGMEENLNLDMVVNGFLLSLNPRQLHRGPQLAAWSERGWFAQPINARSIPRLVALDDATAPLDQRVRSYLDVNCATCHRPGGLSRGIFDARFLTPLTSQGLVNGPLAAGDLGIAGAHVVTAGRPETSILLERLKRDDAMRMPPVNVNHETQPIVPLLEAWIRSLSKSASAK